VHSDASPSDELAFTKDRGQQHKIVLVTGASPGIVCEKGIALVNTGRITALLQNLLGCHVKAERDASCVGADKQRIADRRQYASAKPGRSTMAGPLVPCPGRRVSPSNIGVSMNPANSSK
jgi:hypothetical protein